MTSNREPLCDVQYGNEGLFAFLGRFRAALHIKMDSLLQCRLANPTPVLVVCRTFRSAGIRYFTSGRSVSRKTLICLECTARGASARTVHATEGKVFLDTDRPRPGNNIFIFWLSFYVLRMRIGLFAVMCAERGFPPRNPTNVSYGYKTDNIRYKPRKWWRLIS